MSTTIYCYHCGRRHAKDEMRQIATKGGLRWRCIKSIEGAKKGVAERDAYGKLVTKLNSSKQREKSKTWRHLGTKPPSR